MSIEKLPTHYSMQNHATIYDEEALTALELAARTTGKVNEVVEAQNKLAEDTHNHMEAQDERLENQESKIIPSTVKAEVQHNIDSGAFNDSIAVYSGNLEARVDNLLGKVTEGTSTLDAEVIDTRTGVNGDTYANAGSNVRAQTSAQRVLAQVVANLTQTGTASFNLVGLCANQRLDIGAPAGNVAYRVCTMPLFPIPEGVNKITMKTAPDMKAMFYLFKEDGTFYKTDSVQASEVNYTVDATAKYFRLYGEMVANTSDPIDKNIFETSTVITMTTEKHLSCALLYDTIPGKNLFDPIKMVGGYLDLTRGVPLFPETGYKTTDYIYVAAGESVTCSPYIRKLCCYDMGKVHQSAHAMDVNHTNPVTFTAPFDCYIRVSMAGTIVNSVQIEYGTEVTEYEGYNHKIREYIHMSETMKQDVASMTTGNILLGKKYVACGDSFTIAGGDGKFTDGPFAGKFKSYPYFIGLRNNMHVVNLAKSGQTLTYFDGNMNAFSENLYKEIPVDADYITIKLGINDEHQSVPLGTIDDTQNTTFYGAWNVVMSYILQNYPFAKVGLIVSNGTPRVELMEATRQIAKKWGVPVLDESGDYNVPLLHRVHERPLTADAVHAAKLEAFSVGNGDTHPNDKAHEYESTFVEAWLRTL